MSSKRKITEIEETIDAVTRIKDKVKDSNFDWSLVFPNQKSKINLWWLIASIFIYIVICSFSIYQGYGDRFQKLMFMVGLLSCLWLSSCVHLRFSSKTITSFTLLIAFIGFFVSAELISPKEAVTEIRTSIPKVEMNSKEK